MPVAAPLAGLPKRHALSIAADVGGTFTDVTLIAPNGRILTHKLPSTPHDYADAIVEGIEEICRANGIGAADLATVLHACTVATNAILERKGARVALVTTRGFRDVLEFRRIRVPKLYDPLWRKPAPLVSRQMRLEVTERIGSRGEIVQPIDHGELDKVVETLRLLEVEAIAVCLINSYANPAHEMEIGHRLREEFPAAFITVSSELLPEIREYERTSTTVVNSYVGPVMQRYVRSLGGRLKQASVTGRLMIMQSSGGVLDAETVAKEPARVIECGPAAGVIAALELGKALGIDNLITLDMGGTTAKASLIEGGRLTTTDEYEIGGGISLSSQLVKGGGYALKTPVIDISEVGAGGGSIVRLDKAGQMKVGPDSAGAVPGPVCYGRGGDEPTVTDANLVLGYLNPSAIGGGAVAVDINLARSAIAERIAGPIGKDLRETAFGIHTLANASMMRAVRSVSTNRGRDPAGFTLMAFGGNGGIHGISLARDLGIATVIVPAAAGVFSALGLLVTDIAMTKTQAFLRRLDLIQPDELEQTLAELKRRIRAGLDQAPESVEFRHRASMRYVGQAFELSVDIDMELFRSGGPAMLGEAFESEHERTYGHRFPGRRRIQIVSLAVTGVVPTNGRDALLREQPGAPAADLPPASRPVYFGDAFGLLDTPVVSRGEMGRRTWRGPLIIEDADSTSVIPPDAQVSVDPHGHLIVRLDATAMEGRQMRRATDPIRLELIRNGFDTIADEMALILMRAAYSSIVRDAMDFSTAICDAQGRTLAQGLTTPLHLGSFHDAMEFIIANFEGDLAPGDVLIGNDPYLSAGQHLPDIYIVRPVFLDGRRIGLAVALAHHVDVGGIIPGSNSLGAYEIFQEGLRLPFMKLYAAGAPNNQVLSIIKANVRTPNLVLGDLEAQLVSTIGAEKSLIKLFGAYGHEEMDHYIEELHDYAEALTRQEILEIPDGTYRFQDEIDGLGAEPRPIGFQVELTVAGDRITVDWTGTDKQVQGGINAPFPFTKAASYAALRSVMGADIPNCHGFTRPITVKAPKGTVVNPESPAACGARGITGFRMIDCLLGALAQATPDRVNADSAGGSSLPTFSGWADGSQFVFSETLMGNSGGGGEHDGQEGVCHIGANQSNVPIEIIELDHPIRIERYEAVTDTGGPGRHPGGLAIRRDYRILVDNVFVSIRSDKRKFPPHGLDGGFPGAGSQTLINPGTADEQQVPVLTTTPLFLNSGDLFSHQMAGAGGHGDPLERDPEAVLADVLGGRVSVEAAAKSYRVAVRVTGPDRGEIDQKSTRRLRGLSPK